MDDFGYLKIKSVIAPTINNTATIVIKPLNSQLISIAITYPTTKDTIINIISDIGRIAAK
jgi:hypothetical protein